jgi:aspartyl-tRNA synthetase
MFGCSDNGSKSEIEISETDKVAVAEAHEKITKEGILADFINKISENEFDDAIVLLHPKLKNAWTIDRFVSDWKDIREQIADRWGPEATGSFSGNSSQGPYEQATYRLSSDWRSSSSVDLVSMKTDGQNYIVRVYVRVPYKEDPPKSATETVDKLAKLIFSEKYKEVEGLMTASCKKQFPAKVIGQLRPILGKDETKIEKNYYRFCANTVWYDAVRLNQSGDGFTFIEFILSSENNESEVVSLTFRGKMK